MPGAVLTQLRATWKRMFAVVIAVMVGVAFVTASFLAGNLVNAQLGNQFGNQVRGADIVVTSEGPEITGNLVEVVSGIRGVDDADALRLAYGQVTTGGGGSHLSLGQLSGLPAVRDEIRLTEGRLPEHPGELVITELIRDMNGVNVGDSIGWKPYDASPAGPAQFLVVGMFNGGPSIGLNAVDAFALPEDFSAVATDPASASILVVTDNGANVSAVREAVAAEIGAEYNVYTFEEFVDAAVEMYSNGALQVQILIGVFALIAMFAAGIVIANTFQITIAQRTRELALMRCVGALEAQIRRAVLAEAFLLGGVASAIGVALGIGLAGAVNQAFFDAADRADSLNIQPGMVLMPILVGTIVTVVAALKPAQSATRVHPLQAIRDADAPVEPDRVGRMRRAAAVLLNVIGAAGLAGGALISRTVGVESGTGIVLGVVGGMISFLGVLVAARIIIPPVLSLTGRVAKSIAGVPGELATTNLQRNPGRTSSTSAALLMSVTLVTMCIIGVSTVKETMERFFDERAAIDLDFRIASENGEPAVMTSSFLENIRVVEGVDEIAPVTAATITAVDSDGSVIEFGAVGIDPALAGEVSRSDRIEALGDDIIIVSENLAELHDLAPGEALMLNGQTGAREVEVVVETLLSDEPIMTETTIQAISGLDQPSGVWVRIGDDARVRDVTQDVQDVIPPQMSVEVGGSAHDRETNLAMMDQVLLVAMGLLAAAVLIAVIGVGNTLTLSVLERARESGMLRAMGLTSKQLRRTLAVEGFLLSLVGACVGAFAGTIYGWIGALTLFGDTFPVQLGFPVGQMALVGAAAFGCGLLASVIPAQRALAVTPVEAIATVG